jgi:hypothetical protein
MRFISLSMITRDQRSSQIAADQHDEDEAPEEMAEVGPRTTPCLINVAAIRCFYPRKEDRPGTRLTFTDGGGFVVLEAFPIVRALVEHGEIEVATAA